MKMNFKKIYCTLLSLIILFGVTSCGSEGSSGTLSEDVSSIEETSSTEEISSNKEPSSTEGITVGVMKSGNPSAVGDAFELPKLKFGASGAPVLSNATRQVDPNDTIVITGKGFAQSGLKAYVYAQSNSKNGKSYRCTHKVIDDTEIMIIVDKKIEYGIYGVYIESSAGNSNLLMVNDPEIHWIGVTEVKTGDEFSIYGANLTTDDKNKTTVFLSNGKEYCAAKIIEANPYKVTIEIPKVLKAGKEYTVSVHNGHGGQYGFAEAKEKIKVVSKRTNNFSSGKKIDVTKYGASAADDGNDDTAGINAAIAAAADGDTIYFPNGTYVINTAIKTSKSLKFSGQNVDKVKFEIGKNNPTNLFDVKGIYVEFTGMSFSETRTNGKLTTTFIKYTGSDKLVSYPEIKVYNCRFSQSAPKEYKPMHHCVAISKASNIVFENNETLATTVLWVNGGKKLFFRDNTVYGNLWTGSEYNQNSTLFWNIDMADVSGNNMTSRDALNDKTHILSPGDKSVGRAIVFQGKLNNAYVAENKMVAVGLPNTNAGEEILLETGGIYDMKKPVSATKSTVKVPTDFKFNSGGNWKHELTVGDTVFIAYGTGAGQYRTITKIDGKTLHIDKPWNIIPTSDSTVAVSVGGKNIVIYKNDISGYKNYAEDPGATCGVSTSGSSFGMRIVDNKFSNLPAGIFISQKYLAGASTDKPMGATLFQYFNIVSGNRIENTCKAIRYELYYDIPTKTSNGEAVYLNIGSSCRRNTVKNTKDFDADNWRTLGGMAISLGTPEKQYTNWNSTPTWQGNWLKGIIFENNSFENCKTNILLRKHQGKNVFRNNTAKSGEVLVVENTFSGKPIMFNK